MNRPSPAGLEIDHGRFATGPDVLIEAEASMIGRGAGLHRAMSLIVEVSRQESKRSRSNSMPATIVPRPFRQQGARLKTTVAPIRFS